MDLSRQIALLEDLAIAMRDARDGISVAHETNDNIEGHHSAVDGRYRTKLMELANNPEYAYLLNLLKDDILERGILIPGIDLPADDQYEILGDLSNALSDVVNLQKRERNGEKIVRYPSRIMDLADEPNYVELIEAARNAFVLGHMELPDLFKHAGSLSSSF